MVNSNSIRSIFRGRRRRAEAHVIIAIAVIYLLMWIVLPKPSFWGIDNGFKYQGMKSFAKTGSIQIPYNGRDIDPAGKYRPILKPFGVMNGDHQVPVFSPAFMYVGGMFYFAFGKAGPWLLPLIGGWLTLFTAWLMWIRHKQESDGRLFLIILGLGSPLLFYSLTLWEHTLAMACVTFAISKICRNRDDTNAKRDVEVSIITAALLALAAMFRTESIFWIPIVLIFWRFTKRNQNGSYAFAITSVVGLIIGLGFNKFMTGTAVPLHILTNKFENIPIVNIALIKTYVHNLYTLIFGGFDSHLLSILGLIPLIGIMFWTKWRRKKEQSYIIAALLLLAGSAYLYAAGMSKIVISYTINSGGLLWVIPFVVLVIRPLGSRNTGFWRLAFFSPIVFFIAVLIWLPMVKGVHWGPRFGLEILPFILIIASVRARRWWRSFKPARYVIGVLLLLSICNQLYSYDLIIYARSANARLSEWVAKAPEETVLTNVWWLAGDCAGVSDQKRWYNTPRGVDVAQIVSELRKKNHTKFVFYEIDPLIPADKWSEIGVEVTGTDRFYANSRRSESNYHRSTCKILPDLTNP